MEAQGSLIKAFVGVAAIAVAAALSVPAAFGDEREIVRLTIHNSRFDQRVVTVPAGREVTFVVRNTDPIIHELIVGPEAVQLRHETGNEPRHGAKPGEVTLMPGATASTTYIASTREPITFACHIAGHYAYGMRGVVRVRNR
jgi:uncharacterized cupredoxin-like copper-binding protein